MILTNRNSPEAIPVGLKQLGMPDVGRLRLAIAASLFRDGVVSSGASAHGRQEPCGHPGAPGHCLDTRSDNIADDVAAIDAWLSSERPAA